MTAQLVTIEKASPACFDDVLEILSQVNLPHDGVKEHFDGFLIARSGGGKILGCVGLERHGDLGLLRSAAVLPEYQGQWIGNKLVREILKRAANEGVTEVVLLVHGLDFFREPCGDARARFQQYLRRHPPGGCSRLYLRATYRRGGCDTPVSPACAGAARESAGGCYPAR